MLALPEKDAYLQQQFVVSFSVTTKYKFVEDVRGRNGIFALIQSPPTNWRMWMYNEAAELRFRNNTTATQDTESRDNRQTDK